MPGFLVFLLSSPHFGILRALIFPQMCVLREAMPCVTLTASASFFPNASPLLFLSMHFNFLRLLLLSSIAPPSYRVTNLLSLAITPPQLQSSILQLHRTLSCSAVFDKFGLPPLFSISKCMHCMFQANTISLRTTSVVGIQSL